MASKLKWVKKNTEYFGYAKKGVKEIPVAKISILDNEFGLDAFLFPRNKRGQMKTETSIVAAKNKIQDWWDKFINQNK